MMDRKIAVFLILTLGICCPLYADELNVLSEISADAWLFGWSARIDFDYALYGNHTPPGQPGQFYNGWGSTSGFCPGSGCALPGGEYFFTDLFDLSPTNTAHVWWDFTDNGDVNLRQIALQGVTENGDVFDRFYEVRREYWDASPGQVTLSLPEDTAIRTILFQGKYVWDVPETSSLLLIVLGGITSLGIVRRFC
jgi:hypothetical protein